MLDPKNPGCGETTVEKMPRQAWVRGEGGGAYAAAAAGNQISCSAPPLGAGQTLQYLPGTKGGERMHTVPAPVCLGRDAARACGAPPQGEQESAPRPRHARATQANTNKSSNSPRHAPQCPVPQSTGRAGRGGGHSLRTSRERASVASFHRRRQSNGQKTATLRTPHPHTEGANGCTVGRCSSAHCGAELTMLAGWGFPGLRPAIHQGRVIPASPFAPTARQELPKWRTETLVEKLDYSLLLSVSFARPERACAADRDAKQRIPQGKSQSCEK
eukprot:gene23418-biopygen14870